GDRGAIDAAGMRLAGGCDFLCYCSGTENVQAEEECEGAHGLRNVRSNREGTIDPVCRSRAAGDQGRGWKGSIQQDDRVPRLDLGERTSARTVCVSGRYWNFMTATTDLGASWLARCFLCAPSHLDLC